MKTIYIGKSSANYHGIEIGKEYTFIQEYLDCGVLMIAVLDEDGIEREFEATVLKEWCIKATRAGRMIR